MQGKYLEPGGGPPAARLNRYKGRYAEAESRYGPKPNVREAVRAYVALAWEHGLTPTALALRQVLRSVLNVPMLCGWRTVHVGGVGQGGVPQGPDTAVTWCVIHGDMRPRVQRRTHVAQPYNMQSICAIVCQTVLRCVQQTRTLQAQWSGCDSC